VTDTFERASGSWYRPRGEPRERIAGGLDFGALGIDNERSVESFVAFAKLHPTLSTSSNWATRSASRTHGARTSSRISRRTETGTGLGTS